MFAEGVEEATFSRHIKTLPHLKSCGGSTSRPGVGFEKMFQFQFANVRCRESRSQTQPVKSDVKYACEYGRAEKIGHRKAVQAIPNNIPVSNVEYVTRRPYAE